MGTIWEIQRHAFGCGPKDRMETDIEIYFCCVIKQCVLYVHFPMFCCVAVSKTDTDGLA